MRELLKHPGFWWGVMLVTLILCHGCTQDKPIPKEFVEEYQRRHGIVPCDTDAECEAANPKLAAMHCDESGVFCE